MQGMEKGSGTRSGLLWEIERILTELHDSNSEMPQTLIMENVPDVVGERNRKHFNEWLNRLEELGYHNYWKIINTKNMGLPQNRERCFMVSVLGNYYVNMPPKKIKLKHKLKDLLEKDVPESFYLSEDKLQSIANWKAQQDPLKDIDKEKIIAPTITARGAGEEHSGMVLINESIPIKNATQKGYLEAKEGDGVDISSRMQYHRGTVQKGSCQTLTTAGGENVGVVVGTFNYDKSDNFMLGRDRFCEGKDIANCVLTKPREGIVEADINLKTQLCNKLVEEGKVKEYDVIRHNYTTSKDGDCIQSNNISPTLDTRCDCLGVVVNEEKPIYSEYSLQKICDNIIEGDVAGSITATGMQSINHDGCQLVEEVDLKRGYSCQIKQEREDSNDIDVIGNYSKSNFAQTPVVGKNGVAPTFTENHGQVAAIYQNLRIRKLTPREAFRLQGVANSDIDKMRHYTNSNQFHLAGDSISSVTLMGIFGELLNIDYVPIIEKFIEDNIIEK